MSIKEFLSAKRISWAAFFIYVIITGVLSLRHTMWRDELQLWLISYESQSFAELLTNTSHENRPIGYFILCWLISRFTSNPEILKLTNWLTAIALAYTVLFKIQIKDFIKIAFLFSLIPLIGYSHIAQDYMLGTFLFILLIKFFSESRNKTRFFVLAAIIANIHILFLLASSGFVVVYFIDSIKTQATLRRTVAANTRLITTGIVYAAITNFSVYRVSQATPGAYPANTQFLFLLATVCSMFLYMLIAAKYFKNIEFRRLTNLKNIGTATILACIFAIFIFTQSKDTFIALKGSALNTVNRSLTILASSFFPFIDFQTADAAHRIIELIFIIFAGLLLASILIFSFKSDTRIGIAILVSNLLLLAGMVLHSRFWWHFGVLYILQFSSIILLFGNKLNSQHNLPKRFLLSVILISQFIALFWGPRTDLWERRPYSNSEATAAFLSQNCDLNCTIVVNHETVGASISAYMKGRELFYVDKAQFGTFAQWRTVTNPTWDHMIETARLFADSVIVVSGLTDPPSSLQKLKDFSGAVWADEDFTVYKIIP
jgi:hypothetical protein